MNRLIYPNELKGCLTIPASKSVAHRTLIAAALSDKESMVLGRFEGDDILATIACLTALGADIEEIAGGYKVSPIKKPSSDALLNVKESGSTLRFMLPVAAALGVNAEVKSQGRLAERPISGLVKTLREHGCSFIDGRLSGKLVGNSFTVDGSVSSQYVTGLLLALPILGGGQLVIEGDCVSRGYIDITVEVMRRFGIDIVIEGKAYRVSGRYRTPEEIYVESDWSNAAFFLSGGCLCGDICLKGLDDSSCQGDRVIVELLKKAGGKIEWSKACVCAKKSELHAIEVDLSDCPDLAPILAVTLAFANGTSCLRSVDRLKDKESDRLNAIIAMLAACQIKAYYKDSVLYIEGGQPVGGKIDCFSDHRIAMSGAIMASAVFGSSLLIGSQCVSKSYPSFFEDYSMLGGKQNVTEN